MPAQKPSQQEIAQMTQLQMVNTTALASTETTPLDLATDRTVAMAYAIPTTKPSGDATMALQQQVVVASADPAAAQETMANVAGADTATGLKTRSLGTVVMQDGFDAPDVASVNATHPFDTTPNPSAITALANDDMQDQAQQPFVSSTNNANLNQLITKYASLYDVPESLVHHVVRRETNYNPAAVHRGNWGLMQIRYNTARGLGYSGSPTGLLDAETNLKYAVKYLKGAWIVADKDATKADWLYRTGYYYQAKKAQLLEKLDMQ